MNILKTCWNFLQKYSLALGLPVLLLLGLRRHKDSPQAFTRQALLAFALLTAILGLLCLGAYEDFGLLWPGVPALGFLLVFASALFRIRPARPEPTAKTAAVPHARKSRP